MTSDDPRVSHADREVWRAAETGEGLIAITSREQLLALARAAAAAKDAFDDVAVQVLTLGRARYVRRLRVDDGYTWRAVAETCALAWDGDWGSNQLAGMALCDRAAVLLGEDANAEPWN
jgi:hypothetical protein